MFEDDQAKLQVREYTEDGYAAVLARFEPGDNRECRYDH
jgi:hypothetical protein